MDLPYLKPIKVNQTLYLLVPAEIAKTAGINENTVMQLEVVITENYVELRYRKTD